MISLICIAIAAHLNCFSEFIQHRYEGSVFKKRFTGTKYEKYFNPSIYWRFKWQNGDPNQGERFFLSSTLFVPFVDTFHFVKWLMVASIIMFAMTYRPIVDLPMVDGVLMLIAWGLSFELGCFIYKRKV